MQDSKREEFKNRLVQLCVMAIINGTERVVVDLPSLLNLYDTEISKAREEGRREVLNKETFIGDYDILMQGLHIRTIDRENFLAQIYKTVKERYDWAFGTATYKQALKMIENSLESPLTPYVGLDAMVNEARIKVLSKLTTK